MLFLASETPLLLKTIITMPKSNYCVFVLPSRRLFAQRALLINWWSEAETILEIESEGWRLFFSFLNFRILSNCVISDNIAKHLKKSLVRQRLTLFLCFNKMLIGLIKAPQCDWGLGIVRATPRPCVWYPLGSCQTHFNFCSGALCCWKSHHDIRPVCKQNSASSSCDAMHWNKVPSAWGLEQPTLRFVSYRCFF